jgi:hypothetical protein
MKKTGNNMKNFWNIISMFSKFSLGSRWMDGWMDTWKDCGKETRYHGVSVP